LGLPKASCDSFEHMRYLGPFCIGEECLHVLRAIVEARKRLEVCVVALRVELLSSLTADLRETLKEAAILRCVL
jgi:hypothetical protein